MLTIGLDVGGTSIKSALIEVGEAQNTDTYKILKFATIPSQAGSGKDVLIANIIKAIQRYEWQECEAIAVATAGSVDWDSGSVTYAMTPDYAGTQLSRVLSERFAKRVIVVNDAVSALIGESFMGAGKKADSIMMLTIGTGLGASFLKGRALDRNCVVDTSLGHWILHEDGRQCICGQKGCAEQYVSATALKRYGADNLYHLFHSTDILQKRVLLDFYKDLRAVIERAIELYSPSKIVVGGGVIEMAEYWWQNFLKEYKSKNSTPIAKASLGNKAGTLGSVYAALNGVFEGQ